MKKHGFTAVLIAVILIAAVTASYASATVYVKNKPVRGRTVESRGDTYVDLEAFLRAGGYRWELKGKTIEIGKSGRSVPISRPPVNYTYNGKTVKITGFIISGKTYAKANSLGAALGLRYRFTKAADVHDFYTPGFKPPKRQAKESPDGVDGTPVTGKVKNKEYKFKGTVAELGKSAIQPKNEYNWRWDTGETRGTVYFANAGKDKVTKAKVTMHIVDGYGKPLWSKKFDLGDMDSGKKTKSTDYFWLNPSKFNINDKSWVYEIEYTAPDNEKGSK